MNREPREIVRSFIEQYQQGRDETALRQYLSPEVLDHTPLPGTAPGVAGVSEVFQMLWTALPDMQVQIHQQVAEGDTVVTRKSFVGTQRGELFGVPPTGKTVHLELIDIVRVANGQIVEHWNIVDTYGLLQQLGAVAAGLESQ